MKSLARIVASDWLVSLPLLAIVAYLVLVPVGMIVYGSFRSGAPYESTTWTLENFRVFLSSPRYLQAMLNTLYVSLGSMVISVVIGTVLAWITYRVALRGMKLIQIGIIIPFLMSPFVGSVAWGYLAAPRFGVLNRLFDVLGFGWIDLNVYSIGGIAWVSGIYGVPVVYLFMSSAFQGLDFRLEEIAETTGASRWRIMRTIVLPLVLPALLASALLDFVTAAESFAVPAVLGTPARIDVLATRIANDVHATPANYGGASASAVVLLLVAVIGMLAYQRALRQQQRFVTVTGKSARPAPTRSGLASFIGGGIIVAYLAVAVVLPLAVLLVTSFQKYYGQPWLPIDLTLDNYRDVLFNRRFDRSLRNSLIVSTVGPAICVALGTMVAYISVRRAYPLRRLIDLIATVPIALPGIVLGLALLWTYLVLPIPVYGTLTILIIVAITRRLPYGARFAASTLLQISPELEEASHVAGAGPARTFRRILLPLTAPAMASAFLILFITTFREISSVVLLYGYGTEVLPILLLDLWTEGMFVQVAALTIIQLLVTLVAWLLASRYLRSPLQVMG